MTLLILLTFVARLLFASALGLVTDETYMVAAGRMIQPGYFDHPPLAWWIIWSAVHLAGSDAAIVVRLPFILLFSLTTWLMFRLTADLFDARAGFWAAVLLNASPVFGVTTGSWVLPDGPLLSALLGAALCLRAALPAHGRTAWSWWLATGLCAGLALFSKYTAVLSIAGAVLFLATQPSCRGWLRRPHPYAAALMALAVFSPVLVWNASHGWASLLFQAGRAGSGKFYPFGPVSTLAGEAMFVAPWIWLPLVVCGITALRRGPSDPARWLLTCLALPPILLFVFISVRSHVLFHWAAPGYLMLFPMLGAAVARTLRNGSSIDSARVKTWVGATAAAALLGAALVASEVRFNWLDGIAEHFAMGADPDLDAVDWTALVTDLRTMGLLDRPDVVVAALRWHDAGKIDYALGGQAVVLCLGTDPREYGLVAKPSSYVGDDVVIVAPRMTQAQIVTQLGTSFDSIERLPQTLIRHAGRPAMLLPLFLGHRLHAPT